jgi:hypothetical protein
LARNQFSEPEALIANLKSMPTATTTAVNYKNLPTPSSPNRDIITKKLIEQFGQVRQQASQSAQQMSLVASNKAIQARNWLFESLTIAANQIGEYANRYPPLAAFIFTLLIFSAIPLGIFVLFSIVTSVIFLSIALISFGIVEGICLATGGTVLLAVLGGITFVTAIGFAWIAAFYAFYKGGLGVFARFSESAGYLTQKTQETIQQLKQQSFRSISENSSSSSSRS